MGQSLNAGVCLQQKGDSFFMEITGSAFFQAHALNTATFIVSSCILLMRLAMFFEVWTG